MVLLHFLIGFFMLDLVMVKVLDTPNEKNIRWIMIIYSLFLLIVDISRYISFEYSPIIWYDFFLVILPIFLMLLYKVGKLLEFRFWIAMFISLFVILFINNVGTSFVFEILGLNLHSIAYDGMYGIKNMIIGSIYLVLFYILFKKTNFQIDVYQLKFMNALFIFVLVYASGFLITDIFTIGRNSTDAIFGLFISKFALFSGVLVILAVLLNLSQKTSLNQARQKEKNLKLIMSEQIAGYQSLKDVYEKMAKYRHNINDDFNYLRTLMLNGEYDRATKYLTEMSGHVTDVSAAILEETGNKDINVLWTNHVNSLKNKTVDTRWIGRDLAYLSLDKLDVIHLFSNLLNNAFEAASNTTEGFVNVSTGEKNGYILFMMKNSYFELNVAKNGELKTSKKDVNIHGYGTKIIDEIVAKYAGSITYEYSENVFITQIVLPLLQKND